MRVYRLVWMLMAWRPSGYLAAQQPVCDRVFGHGTLPDQDFDGTGSKVGVGQRHEPASRVLGNVIETRANSKTLPASWKGLQVVGTLLAAADVGCLETLRSLEQVELNRFAFVQRAIAVFLDCGEVNENVFACGALNEPVSLGPVKPLYCTLLSHKVLLSPLVIEFAAILREACASTAPSKNLSVLASGHLY